MKTRIATLAAAAAAAIALLAGTSSPPPATAAVGTYTGLIGDSVTHHGKDNIRARRSGWDIDGVPGSRVESSPARVQAMLKRHGGKHPATLVVALGTNHSTTWGVSEWDYFRKKLPNTRIVFVTPVRDPFVVGRELARKIASTTYHQILKANADKRMCVVPWAETVNQNPGLLRDGVHGTAAGEERWAVEVIRGTDACVRTER